MFLLIAYGLPFLVCFVLALLMPGRRSLAVLAAVVGAPLAWLVFASFRSMGRAPGGAILGVMVVTGIVVAAAAGLVSGVATRWALLRFPHIRASRMRSGALVLSGLLIVPALLAASMWRAQQAIRVPDASCLAASHHVSLGGVQLRLPSAPLFTIWMEDEKPYASSDHRQMRAFCGISAGAGKPVHAVNLTIKTNELRYQGPPQRDQFCASSKEEWARQLCQAGSPSALSSDAYPDKISVYATTEYDHQRMLASERGSYSGFIKERNAAERSGQALELTETEDFTRYANGYWIARDRMWMNDAGEPFTLYCYETTPAGMLVCSTTYLLKRGPQVSYSFRAHRDELAAVSRTVDANFHGLMSSLTNTGGLAERQ